MFKIVTAIFLLFCSVSPAWSQTWMRGNWEGVGYQTDSQETWTMNLKVRGKKFLIEYPSLGCSGQWQRHWFNKRTARFRERIKTNVEQCEPSGNVIIQRLNARQLLFIYSYTGKTDVVATALLNRKK